MSDERFHNQYRIPSARAKWHEYNGGMYFVTVCTQNREHYFGEIQEGAMHLTEIGKCLNEEIVKTPKMRADMNLEIPLYVIMPNHIHLIVIIGNNIYNSGDCWNDKNAVINDGRDAMHCVSMDGPINKFAPQSKNLSSVIRGIKISTTTYARHHNLPFAWQSRFHDHIIRGNEDMNKIADYIENNVSKWEYDKFYG